MWQAVKTTNNKTWVAVWILESRWGRQMKYRVWWDPQVGGNKHPQFHTMVSTIEDAVLVLDMLAEYDLYQYAIRIKPDYANMGGVEERADEEWEDVYIPEQ